MSKVDKELGAEVRKHLTLIGIETPMKERNPPHSYKVNQISFLFKDIMELLNLDLSDDSLQDTPDRVAKMFVNEIFYGLDYANFPKATTVENKMNYDQMVIEKNITTMSTCEHHFVTIDGKTHIAYIPNNKVLGLSKLNRIADFFAKRPQIQERLTQQIGETLKFILDTEDVAVVVDAVHYCVKSRGIKDTSSSTTTSFLSGAFKDNPEVRQEFYSNIRD